MVKFLKYPENKPKAGETVLIKATDDSANWSDIKYYVCHAMRNNDYDLNGEDDYSKSEYLFEEAGGEQYSCWSGQEVEAWMPINQLDEVEVE